MGIVRRDADVVVMTPEHPRIFHIVHGDRLKSIMNDGGLHCDARMINRPSAGTTIGMTNIKERRLRWRVPCHPGICVGDYVPFYFCPRSPMLYSIHRKNTDPDSESDLAYGDGQEPIVHLEADLREVVDWANYADRRWAFSTGNAAAAGVQFHDDLDRLDRLDWNAVEARQWQEVMKEKQAEFLVHGFVPWRLVSGIGVISDRIRKRVLQIIEAARHEPRVMVKRHWYY